MWVNECVWSVRERQVVVYPPRCCARRVASILRPLNLRCISWLAITRARTLLLNAMLIVCPSVAFAHLRYSYRAKIDFVQMLRLFCTFSRSAKIPDLKFYSKGWKLVQKCCETCPSLFIALLVVVGFTAIGFGIGPRI